jgi:hypothetical protein
VQLTNTWFQDSALTELLSQLRAIYLNGGAEFAQFQVADVSLQQWFAHRTWQDEVSFVAKFLQDPMVVSTLATLQIQPPLTQPPEIELGSPLTLEGELAHKLSRGGAYKSFSGTGVAAKAIGQKFCTALFGDRYEDVTIYKSPTAWSVWFGAVGWDCTWIGLDRRNNQVWILALTDTD